MTQKVAAAIDIGSNSILLTVAQAGAPHPIPLNIIIDEAHVTGLAKGLSKEATISRERRERSAAALKHYAKILADRQIQHVKVTGTEAFRKAGNGQDVKKEFESILGTPIEIISGDREAELSFWSVQKEMGKQSNPILVFDIGGASTELCLGSMNGIEHRISLKIGSVLLTEKFHLQNKSSADEALKFMKNLLNELSWKEAAKNSAGVGVAGTITSLLACEKTIDPYERSKVHGQKISRDRVEYWMRQMLSRDSEDRHFKGLSMDRADVFGGGLVITLSLMDFFGWNEIVCMDSGVRFGVLYELLSC